MHISKLMENFRKSSEVGKPEKGEKIMELKGSGTLEQVGSRRAIKINR